MVWHRAASFTRRHVLHYLSHRRTRSHSHGVQISLPSSVKLLPMEGWGENASLCSPCGKNKVKPGDGRCCASIDSPLKWRDVLPSRSPIRAQENSITLSAKCERSDSRVRARPPLCAPSCLISSLTLVFVGGGGGDHSLAMSEQISLKMGLADHCRSSLMGRFMVTKRGESEFKNGTRWGVKQSDSTHNVFLMKRSKWSFSLKPFSALLFPYVQASSICSLLINREVLWFFFFLLDWQRMSFLTSKSFWPPITPSKGSSRWQAMTKADMHTATMTHHKKRKKTVEVMVTSAKKKARQGKKKGSLKHLTLICVQPSDNSFQCETKSSLFVATSSSCEPYRKYYTAKLLATRN